MLKILIKIVYIQFQHNLLIYIGIDYFKNYLYNKITNLNFNTLTLNLDLPLCGYYCGNIINQNELQSYYYNNANIFIKNKKLNLISYNNTIKLNNNISDINFIDVNNTKLFVEPTDKYKYITLSRKGIKQ